MKKSLIVIVSLILGFIISIIPFPYPLNILFHNFIVLIFISLVVFMPEYIGVGYAWIIGFIIDLLFGSMFGVHALALVLISYLIIKFHFKIVYSDLLQQFVIILCMLILYQLVIFLIQLSTQNYAYLSFWYWLSPIIDAIALLFWFNFFLSKKNEY